jgi:CobQ-like glutamine amidotransferase family enzyme
MNPKTNYLLTIGWLYPQLMSTYGDRGNILVLQKRCEWRGVKTKIINIDDSTNSQELTAIDLLFGGGAQDREQEIVMKDLMKKKEAIKKHIESEKPALFVCGAPQLIGKYYEPAVGKRITGLGIFDMVSKHPGPNQDRLIGNIIADVSEFLDEINYAYTEKIDSVSRTRYIGIKKNKNLIVGFENHGGRTYLGESAKPFAKVIKGYGNNGEDRTEGVVYKNAIGSYLHGPLLPKNPQIADWLITKALEIKYKKEITLESLDDSLEQRAKETIANRLDVGV